MVVWAVSLSTTDLSAHSLSAHLKILVFLVWLIEVNFYIPTTIQSFTPNIYINGHST